jgi:hypothetical protein
MSKYLNVPNGDYKISVQEGGNITLNTGFETGQVIITGNLLVQGNTTTVQSEDLTVRDNIIVVNSGENGAGITLDRAGLRIDRGSLSDGYILFDENITWRDPISETTKTGGFIFRDDLNTLVGIRTNSISTGGGDLYLINAGTGVISVTGTNNYENQVTDDDHITNKKYVDNAITTAFATVLLTQIGAGAIDPTTVKALDFEVTGTESTVEVAIDNNTIANFYIDRIDLDGIRITGTTIETTIADSDLILSAPGAGHVRVQDMLQITSVPHQGDVTTELYVPTDVPADGMILYVSNQAQGGTGLFFLNAESTKDEIISNNRSLVYSMIF